jgi:UDP-2,3-diacylglucosamine hydrolase
MHVFISDAHIRKDDSPRGEKLIRFLTEMRPKLTSLYILGDLFEFWFEYNVVIPKDYFRILAALYNLIQDGIPVHYVLGNHEVMIGDFLKYFGFIVHNDTAVLTIHNKRVFLAHGHNIDKRLWTSIWQQFLTSKLNHELYRMLHPDIGVFIAQGIAYLSRKQKRSTNIAGGLEHYGLKKLNETGSGLDVVILAHSHIPEIKKYVNGKYYINTGDWIDHFSYAVMDGDNISLRYYR